MRYDQVSSATIDDLERRIERELSSLPALETAAQRLSETLFEAFAESTVLVRVFVTVPFGELPAANRTFVETLAGGREAIGLRTPVLSLLGTRGRLPRWNDRRLSEGHVGIPLASAEFVDAIPMIASLLKQLGVEISGSGGLDTGIVSQSLGKAAGVFYVEDAAASVDASGRAVIAAQDFVREHGVRTVFGFGGAYALTGTFVVTILFTSEAIARAQADRFMRLANQFKASTMRAVGRGRIFAD